MRSGYVTRKLSCRCACFFAVHPENDPNGDGFEQAYAVATGGHKAGVLNSSFVAEVKSDLMGEQTILCGMLQTGSILCFDKMKKN
jgi:ketol-acid reductoisomerase